MQNTQTHFVPLIGAVALTVLKQTGIFIGLLNRLDCRKLYGSALVGLLKDGSRGGATPKGTRVRQYTMDVLEWVIDANRTPQLKAISCLGTTARDLVADVLLDRYEAAEFKSQEV